jgi:hypothetical protein
VSLKECAPLRELVRKLNGPENHHDETRDLQDSVAHTRKVALVPAVGTGLRRVRTSGRSRSDKRPSFKRYLSCSV